MRKFVGPIMCSAAVLAMYGCGGSGSDAPGKTTVAVIGDVPYGATATDTSQTTAQPAFLKALDSDPDVSFVMHVGDIHSGSQYCTQAYDLTVAASWGTEEPAGLCARR